MRLRVDSEMLRQIQTVKLDSNGYSLTNEGKVNTHTLLKNYASFRKQIDIVDSLPTKMINVSGLFNQENQDEDYSQLDEEDKIQNLIENTLSDGLNTTYKINDSLICSDQYCECCTICRMIDSAIRYLKTHDAYGDLIEELFVLQFATINLSIEEKKDKLNDYLNTTSCMETKIYNKYKKYTIYKIDEYLFSEKNANLHFLNGYIFDKCRNNYEDSQTNR